MKINLALIKASPHPIRTSWDEDKLNELAQSLKEQGQIVPIKVRPIEGREPCYRHGFEALDSDYDGDDNLWDCLGCRPLQDAAYWAEGLNEDGSEWAEHDTDNPKPIFEIVYGHRRVEAARRAGFTDIEATVEGLDDTDTLVQAFIENIQREDMSPLDTARALKELKALKNWSNMDIQRHGIMANGTASRLLSLLNEPEPIQKLVQDSSEGRGITERHVTETRSVLPNDDDKIAVLEKAAAEHLSAEQTRRVAESIKEAPTEQAKRNLLEREYSPVLHDPEFIRERKQQFGAYDPLYKSNAPTPTQEWREAPEVKAILDRIKSVEQWLPDVARTAEIGKMSPEAKPFIARKLIALARAIEETAKEMGGD